MYKALLPLILFTTMACGTRPDPYDQIISHNDTTPFNYEYMIHIPHDGDLSHVLYYFHGHGGNATTWVNANRDIIDYWNSIPGKSPVVVSVSFGIKWLFADTPDVDNPYRFFMDIIMGNVESQLSSPVNRRSLLGVSMGGYNGLVIMADHRDKFQKAALISPAIYQLSPFAGTDERCNYIEQIRPRRYPFKEVIKRYVLRKDTFRKNVNYVLDGQVTYFKNDQIWRSHTPFLRFNKPVGNPEFYISCGDHDMFGFYQPAKRLHTYLSERGITSTFQSIKGGHIVKDPLAIADFLIAE